MDEVTTKSVNYHFALFSRLVLKTKESRLPSTVTSLNEIPSYDKITAY